MTNSLRQWFKRDLAHSKLMLAQSKARLSPFDEQLVVLAQIVIYGVHRFTSIDHNLIVEE